MNIWTTYKNKIKNNKKQKVEEQKSMGHIKFIYRNKIFQPIGFSNSDFLENKIKDNSKLISDFENDISNLK